MANGLFSSGGTAIKALFGSDEAPQAILNRYAAPTAKASQRLATQTLDETGAASRRALDTYLAGQPTQERLAGEQEGVLRTLLQRRLGSSPDELLGRVGQTAFGFIDPNVVSPLARFDVNYDTLTRRARGLNPAAVDSTANRLRTARVASGRYYDTARDVINRLPELYGRASDINEANLAAAAGYIPQAAGAYENVAARPTTGILNRLRTAGEAQNVGSSGISNVLAATQGYRTPQNFADRLGTAVEAVGGGLDSALGQAAGALGGGGGGGL